MANPAEVTIAVVNNSPLGAAAFKKMFSALVFQIERDYNNSGWVKAGIAPRAQLVKGEVPSGAWPVTIAPSGGGGSFLLGWHEVSPSGTPQAFVNYALAGKSQTCLVLSHEILEMLCNPYLTAVYTDPATGYIWRGEVCDPVEKVTYVVQEQTVSDFCEPTWFGLEDGISFPWFTSQKAVDAPFTLAPEGAAEFKYATDPQDLWREAT